MATGDLIRAAESGGDPNAKNPNSSASGPDQFIDSTWLATLKANRPDLVQGQSDQALLALKSDPQLSGEMRDTYAAQNQGILSKNGLPVTPGTTYLAHFAGPQGAIGLLNADPTTPAASVLGQGFAKANPTLAGYTAGDLAAWANRKMGVQGTPAQSAPMSIAGPAPTSAAAAPSQPAPQQPQARASTQMAGGSAPMNLATLTAVPQLANLLPQRPNPFGLKIAPFSLRG